ncbi:Bro-N domain-containing protein [Vulgatibacter sp.]|uniref:BRO-N domain-containing protein n=1 Tax=Vulgatibacter sp. TaxID=1971226 RepID=UPI003564AF45
MSLPAKIESAFEGQTLVTFTVNGRPCWIARDVGALLGYADDGRRLPSKIAGDWSEELIEGQDFAILTGSELEAFKQAALDTESVPSRAPSLLLLFETGLHLVCLKTRSEVGRKLRRFLADEVLPQLVRTGEYSPEVSLADEERRTKRADLLFAIVGKLEQHGNLSPASKAELYARCYREATGEDAPALLPVVDSHPHTCTSVGAALGISHIKVGKIAREIGIWNRAPYCEVRLSKSRHSDRQVEQTFFSEDGKRLIEAARRGRGAA